MQTFVKQRPDAPPGFFAVEAAGLEWLARAEPDGGVRVAAPVESVAMGARRITLPRIVQVAPSPGAALDFGRQLAATHRAGASWFGCPPEQWHGDGFIGPITLPHNISDEGLTWGQFFARYRLAPFARTARDRGALSADTARVVDRICARLEDGDAALCGGAARGAASGSAVEPVARLHGDLWSGNVLWSADGVVLVDPAAHGGHRESDLAMLALFGLPYLDRVLASYDEAYPLADGWRERVGVHQLHPLLVHAVLFGASYGAQVAATAARY